MEVSEMEERKIGQIKEELKAATEAMLPSFILSLITHLTLPTKRIV